MMRETTKEWWINVYPPSPVSDDYDMYAYASRNDAMRNAVRSQLLYRLHLTPKPKGDAEMTTLRSFGRLLGMSALAGVFAAAIMTGVDRLRANIGVPPQGNAGFALVDNQWLVGSCRRY